MNPGLREGGLHVRLPLLTASKLQRVAICAASAVLPRVDSVHERSQRGTVIHRFLERVAQLTGAGGTLAAAREEALTEVPEEYREACASIDLDVLPLDGMRWLQEVTYAVDVVTGRARVIGCGLTREQAYGALDPSREIGGTADVVGISADGLTIVVLDFKTGRGEIARALVNLQVRYLALAGARAHGAINARVALTKIKDSGLAWHDEATFDALDVDLILEDLRALHRGVVRAADAQAAGAPLPIVTGSHCEHCDAMAYCPAQTALVRTVVGEIEEGREVAGPLTPETAGRAWEKVKAVEAAIKRAKSALYTFAAGTPIPLPGGLVLGPVESSKEAVDGARGRVALLAFEAGLEAAVYFAAWAQGTSPDPALASLRSWKIAERACSYDTSKAAIERALRPVAADLPGGKITRLTDAVVGAVRAAGGITKNTTSSVREHVPSDRARLEIAELTEAMTAGTAG